MLRMAECSMNISSVVVDNCVTGKTLQFMFNSIANYLRNVEGRYIQNLRVVNIQNLKRSIVYIYNDVYGEIDILFEQSSVF